MNVSSTTSPVFACQNLRVLSELPLTIWYPSGVKATLMTASVCPVPLKPFTSLPVLTSHSLRVLSRLPLTILFPHGLKATLVTLYFMHVRFDKAVVVYMICAFIFTYAVYMGLTMTDYVYR